ncbi:GNAT family N-acetyltransferase [Terriglobus saanensis]|uniref:GCN5-related N-acetyltransferase n=1 Tax=Terriglobus saanensis (strain ATCC BAA-1853 / DSM 23119 / SP1PR4) TaxID=401053 RepID=E8UXX2_TERSS|nr:GNAT family N-acetyltransferase [Terriglobus saanensis]ADV84206.1 GCN5-related N-acetyltransferase [Terriglobus saanensis SP1PR4]
MDTSSPDLTIRHAELQDALEISRLAWQLGYERSPEAVRVWIECLGTRTDHQAAFVACTEEEVVGWIEVSVENRIQTPPFALIGGLVVKDGIRGAGIGRRLCEEAEIWARQHGLERIRVTSRSTREAAHRFYLRDGYREVKTSLVFEKKLSEKA